LPASATAPNGHPSTGSGGGRKVTVPSHTYDLTIVSDVVANGHVVLVDLWPGRRLPPMPDPSAQTTDRSFVNASLGGWPDSLELPLPELGTVPEPGANAAAGAATFPRGGVPSRDGAAESDDQSIALLAVFDVDPWGMWPSIDELPIPDQMVPAIAAAGEQADASVDEAPPLDAGAAPIDFGPAAVLAAAVGAFGAVWRRREQLLALAATQRGWLSPRRWLVSLNGLAFGRQAARALALLRLTLGIFRLW
jgi:hypothetical protein